MTSHSGDEQTGNPEVVGVRRGMFGPTGTGDTSGYGRLVREVSMPGSSPRPYGGYFDEVVDTLTAVLGEEAFEAAIERVVVYRDQLTLEVRREHLPVVMQALRDDPALRFELCLGVSGVHYPQDSGRELHAFYPLMSITTTAGPPRGHLPDETHILSIVSVHRVTIGTSGRPDSSASLRRSPR